MLEKAGAPIGNKSCLNLSLPQWIKYVGSKEYLRAVFTDEGSSVLRTIKTQRHKYWSILLHITHGTSREITSELNEDVKGILT